MRSQLLAPLSPPAAEAVWSAAFQELCERVGPIFARSETRQTAQGYLGGLLSPLERKNGWQLAEEAGEATPYAMQYLLDRARWRVSACAMSCAATCASGLGTRSGQCPIGANLRELASPIMATDHDAIVCSCTGGAGPSSQ
jgi:hypothetical protein